MTAPSHIRTAVARDPLNDWKRPIGHDMPRASDEHNRAAAAAWLEARRRRTGRQLGEQRDELNKPTATLSLPLSKAVAARCNSVSYASNTIGNAGSIPSHRH